MKKKQSIKRLRKSKARFCRIQTVKDLATLVGIEAYKLRLLAMKPEYYLFSRKKRDGSKRWIEEPAKPLKKVQRILNHYLQATYYFQRSDAAYGFMLVAKRDPDPRHIVTNAAKHLGCKYLFNADVEDFFHRIKSEQVLHLFQTPPFDFDPDLAELLVQLTTHQGRLPMGTPTSPVLSNFACKQMDEDLLTLAQWGGWVFTRYVDDLSFSSSQPFKETEVKKVYTIVEDHHFSFNSEKIHFFGPEEEKQVTGLRLGEKVELPEAFINLLQSELLKLKHIVEVEYRLGQSSKWVTKFREQVQGKMNYATMVLGEKDELSGQLFEQYEAAIDPPNEFGSVSWLDFPYT